MTDHIDTAQERDKLAALEGHTPGPWSRTVDGCIGPEGSGVAVIVAANHHGHQCADRELITAAPDLLDTCRRLLDAIDAERARAEKAEAELNRAADVIATILYRIGGYTERSSGAALDAVEQLIKERDQALARLAVAYEAAARRAEDQNDEIFDGFTGDKIGEDAVAQSIRALTPADAKAALQRVVDRTWNEAVEAAAEIAAMHGKPPNTQWANGYAAACRDNVEDILALKRPEAGHE